LLLAVKRWKLARACGQHRYLHKGGLCQSSNALFHDGRKPATTHELAEGKLTFGSNLPERTVRRQRESSIYWAQAKAYGEWSWQLGLRSLNSNAFRRYKFPETSSIRIATGQPGLGTAASLLGGHCSARLPKEIILSTW